MTARDGEQAGSENLSTVFHRSCSADQNVVTPNNLKMEVAATAKSVAAIFVIVGRTSGACFLQVSS
jgi:hypothetical protein